MTVGGVADDVADNVFRRERGRWLYPKGIELEPPATVGGAGGGLPRARGMGRWLPLALERASSLSVEIRSMT